MSLSPEELERATFPVVKHGYDPRAVQRFLSEISTTLRESDDFRRAGDEVATALRGLHGLLSVMKAEAEDDVARMRTEAQEEARRLRHDAAEDARRLRAEAESERDELITQAQSEVRSLLEEARAEREEAERMAAAVERTVAAKRTEFEEYLVAVTTLAESTARARVASVLDGYRAEVDRLVTTREQMSAALQIVGSALERAVAELGADMDLTERSVGDERLLQPPPLDGDAVEEAVAHALESLASPIEQKPGQFR